MALLFFGKDPNTNGHNCPTVWVDEQSADLLIQGWNADEETKAECLKSGPIPDSEGVVRVPARMADLIRKACDAAEQRSAVQ